MSAGAAAKPLWEGRRVLVCLGTGGVGKTTLSAALALAAALAGRRTLVMTIDPARRLAQALGLGDVGNVARRVDLRALGAPTVPAGSLDVLMPDVRGTFDAVVSRWAPSEKAAQAIFANRIYQHFAGALAGSHEYAAVEKLYEVVETQAYDLIVLDTPPAQNAMAFLQAPGRILAFLGGDAVTWLLKRGSAAGRLGGRLFDLGGNVLLKGVGKVAGTATLGALIEFVGNFGGMYEGFVKRAEQMRALFRSPELGFVLVGAPSEAQTAALLRFVAELGQEGLEAQAVVLNRSRPPLDGAADEPAWQAFLAPLPEDARAALTQALQQEVAASAQDAAAIAALRAGLGALPLLSCPDLGPTPQLWQLAQALQSNR